MDASPLSTEGGGVMLSDSAWFTLCAWAFFIGLIVGDKGWLLP